MAYGSTLLASSPVELRQCGRQVVSSSPTKFNRALGELAIICGALSGTALFRILLPSASRWAMDFQLALSLVAEHRWINLVPPLATQIRSPEIQLESRRRTPC